MSLRVALAPRTRFPTAALLLSVGASGCAIPTRVVDVSPEIPRQLTPVAIDSSLKALDDVETKRRMEHLLASSEMKDVQRELIAGLVDGSLAALSDKERSDRAGKLAAQYAAGLMHSLSHELTPAIGPLSEQAVRGAVRGAMSEAFGEQGRREMQRFVGDLGQEGFSKVEIASAVSGAMTNQIGPAIQKVLTDNIGPGIAGALRNEEVHRELGNTARLMGREMVLGADEALQELREKQPSGASSGMSPVSELLSKGTKLAGTLTWLLGLAVLLLGAWIVKLLLQARKFRTETEQRASTVRALNEALRAAEGKPWSDELRAALADQFKSNDDALLQIRGGGRSARG